MKFCRHSKGLTPYPLETGLAYLRCNECGVDLSPNIIPVLDRAEKAEARIEDLEATLKSLAAQAMYGAGYTKKEGWKNDDL